MTRGPCRTRKLELTDIILKTSNHAAEHWTNAGKLSHVRFTHFAPIGVKLFVCNTA